MRYRLSKWKKWRVCCYIYKMKLGKWKDKRFLFVKNVHTQHWSINSSNGCLWEFFLNLSSVRIFLIKARIKTLFIDNRVFPWMEQQFNKFMESDKPLKTEFKDPAFHMCLAGTVVSWCLPLEMAGSNPFTWMTNIFVTGFSEFNENI